MTTIPHVPKPALHATRYNSEQLARWSLAVAFWTNYYHTMMWNTEQESPDDRRIAQENYTRLDRLGDQIRTVMQRRGKFGIAHMEEIVSHAKFGNSHYWSVMP